MQAQSDADLFFASKYPVFWFAKRKKLVLLNKTSPMRAKKPALVSRNQFSSSIFTTVNTTQNKNWKIVPIYLKLD